MIKRFEKCYILDDYTKFDWKSLYKICDWSKITALVTNKETDIEKIRKLQAFTNVITS